MNQLNMLPPVRLSSGALGLVTTDYPPPAGAPGTHTLLQCNLTGSDHPAAVKVCVIPVSTTVNASSVTNQPQPQHKQSCCSPHEVSPHSTNQRAHYTATHW